MLRLVLRLVLSLVLRLVLRMLERSWGTIAALVLAATMKQALLQ